MPLAKAAPPAQPVATETPKDPKSIQSFEEILHPEFCRYFEINPVGNRDDRLTFIYKWANENADNMPEALYKLKEIERKLGAVSVGESRLGRVYNYLRVSDNVANAVKSINKELDSLKKGHSNRLREIKNAKEDRIKKILDEIKRVEAEFGKQERVLSTSFTKESEERKKIYKGHLSELALLKKAYGG